jgi:hypothetical protein
LAPPDTTIDLTKETSPPSSSNQASAAASTLLSLVTVPTSVAAAASTSLYRQLYSAAEDNDDKEDQLYSDDNEDDDNDDDEDYVGIHKQPIDEDYDDILDMDIDSEEEFRSSFPKNPNSSKLRVKGGDQRPDVSDLSEKVQSRQGMPAMNYCDTVLYGLRQQRRDAPRSMSAESQ